MKKINIYTFSKSNVTRHIVIDHSVIIEEFVTETIGRLLDIDWKTSEALGSGGLNFHQKISLIKDKVGNIVDKNKIAVFSQIRNKFAHLNISTWEDLFSISKDKTIQKNLNNWYKLKEINEKNPENKVRIQYYFLTCEIFHFLIEINTKWAEDKGKKIASENINQKLFELTITNPSEDIQKVWDQIKEELS